MVAYLKKLKVPYRHDIEREVDYRFMADARRLITVKDIPALGSGRNGRQKPIKFGAQAQSGYAANRQTEITQRVSRSLAVIRRDHISDVPPENVMITCRKELWFGRNDNMPGPFAKWSRMFKARWVPNVTRGTNDYVDCSHLIYLWDQNIHPAHCQWLRVNDSETKEEYALSELIQWVYRSRVRRGEPITLYMPCQRMRELLLEWMNGEVERVAA